MPDPDDVRDLGGRVTRVVIAIVLAIPCSLALALVLPARDHFDRLHYCMRTTGWLTHGDSLTLVLIGVVVFALAINTLLAYLARVRARAPRLPRAIGRYRVSSRS